VSREANPPPTTAKPSLAKPSNSLNQARINSYEIENYIGNLLYWRLNSVSKMSSNKIILLIFVKVLAAFIIYN